MRGTFCSGHCLADVSTAESTPSTPLLVAEGPTHTHTHTHALLHLGSVPHQQAEGSSLLYQVFHQRSFLGHFLKVSGKIFKGVCVQRTQVLERIILCKDVHLFVMTFSYLENSSPCESCLFLHESPEKVKSLFITH